MHAFALSFRSVFFASIEQSHQQSFEPSTTACEETPSRRVPTDGRARDRSRRNPLPTRTKNPPPRAPTSTRFPQPIDVGRALARACTPSVSMRVPPSMRVPRVHTYPFHPPSRRSRTRRSGHVHGPRAGERARPPPTTQKTKKKRKEPPSPLHKCKNKHPRGRATSYSTHPRVRPITSRTRVRDG